jgi:hypothetical protein
MLSGREVQYMCKSSAQWYEEDRLRRHKDRICYARLCANFPEHPMQGIMVNRYMKISITEAHADRDVQVA